jgi:hypothetical protein
MCRFILIVVVVVFPNGQPIQGFHQSAFGQSQKQRLMAIGPVELNGQNLLVIDRITIQVIASGHSQCWRQLRPQGNLVDDGGNQWKPRPPPPLQ